MKTLIDSFSETCVTTLSTTYSMILKYRNKYLVLLQGCKHLRSSLALASALGLDNLEYWDPREERGHGPSRMRVLAFIQGGF